MLKNQIKVKLFRVRIDSHSERRAARERVKERLKFTRDEAPE